MEDLIINNLSKSYGRKKVLLSVNLKINPGIYGLLGPNGAGKTTLMRIIATVLKPDSGSITFNNIDLIKNPNKMREIIGYLPQEFGCFRNITAYECLDYIAALKGVHSKKSRNDQIQYALEEVNLVEQSNVKVGKFSGGMKRRLGIAQTMLGNPKLIMVDEPTAGLDPEERIRFRNLIRRLAKDRMVILSTHIVEDIQAICDGVAVLKAGEITQFSSLNDLALIAKNKVWSLKIHENDYAEIALKYKVISSNALEDGLELRVLSDSQPSSYALPVDSTIEEGFLKWING